jgi:hypothetical protein
MEAAARYRAIPFGIGTLTSDSMDGASVSITPGQRGQQAKDDMFAIQEIAKQRDEADLDALLASGTLANLNLSDTMRANLANIRFIILNPKT